MSIANHHIVPGKKLWTWGNGPRGRMWDKILTDDDGPYIELMVGAYSDNQPDYSWLQPLRDEVVQHVLVSVPGHRRRQERQPRRRASIWSFQTRGRPASASVRRLPIRRRPCD